MNQYRPNDFYYEIKRVDNRYHLYPSKLDEGKVFLAEHVEYEEMISNLPLSTSVLQHIVMVLKCTINLIKFKR